MFNWMLRRLLRPLGSPSQLIIYGVPCLVSGTVCRPGLQVGTTSSSGGVDGIVYFPGLKTGQTGCTTEG